MTRASCVFLVVAVASSAVHVARTARAGEGDAAPAADPVQEARQQYESGMQAYQGRRFVEAALHFEAAAAQRSHAVALYTAALAWEQANRPERAADDFGRALEVQGLSASQEQSARDRLSVLEKTMGTAAVTAPDGWRVQLDANTQVLAPARLHAMPGVHALTAQPSSGPIQHEDVTLELGKVAHVELAAEDSKGAEPPPAPRVIEPPREAPPPPPPDAEPSVRRLAGVALAGAGVASLAAGAVLGANALSAKKAYDAAPSQAGYDHALSLQTSTTVVFIAGGVFVAGGVALALWPSPKKHDGAAGEPAVSLAPTLGGAVLRGVF